MLASYYYSYRLLGELQRQMQTQKLVLRTLFPKEQKLKVVNNLHDYS